MLGQSVMLRQSAMKSFEDGNELKDNMQTNAAVMKFLDDKELDEIMEPSNYLGTVKEQINRALKECA